MQSSQIVTCNFCNLKWGSNVIGRVHQKLQFVIAGHVIPRLEGEKLQVMRQFLETQQMAAQVKLESSKL